MRGGGVPVPLFPEINWLVPLLPKIENLLSYVPCSPILSLFPSKLAFVPLKLMSFFPVPQNSREGLIVKTYVLTKTIIFKGFSSTFLYT